MTYLLDPDQLEREGIHTVLVATPDLQGRLVGRRIPAERLPSIIECGIEICTCAWAWDVEQSFDLIGAGVLAVCSMHNGAPDVALVPDVGTLRRAAWLDGVAICLADPVWPGTGEPLEISPRVMLKKELARYRSMGYSPQAGTELEFYLFANNPRALRKSSFREDLDPTTLTPSDFTIHEGNGYEPFFQKLRRNLRESGIEMEAGQSEWGTGQWEMTFAYGEPLEMADRHALYKLAVRDSAVAAGLSVTFMARPLNDQPGSSCHVHLSLRDDAGRPVFWDPDAEHHMSGTLRSAVAGVLEHTPAFMVWYAPTINSYRRTNSQEIAGYGRTWAVQNRSVSARVVGHTSAALRFEYRIPGADTNPYLTLGGVLASARDGIERTAKPPAMTVGNAYDGDVDAAMPTQLAEAAGMFATSDFVRRLIGEESTSHFRHLAELEWRVYQSTVTQWDLQRYFDRI
ncbi:glutamine synthetase family protein [Prauserella halophila]|uniref:Glutamine synthetase family protein n=1 Tax=Prauserella halophila TaxID=185641 RepID=A0ABN1WFZ6_9PSEU|nr:glutamine synthetase family protein [Prauserella halophila]MCP2238201.1 glutamine synthetase [Prauserella halophila]